MYIRENDTYSTLTCQPLPSIPKLVYVIRKRPQRGDLQTTCTEFWAILTPLPTPMWTHLLNTCY